MTSDQRIQVKEAASAELNSLKDQIANLKELCKPIAPECALGDLARFELMNDQVITAKTLQEAKIRQSKLEYALRKMENASYGLCVECEDEISFERLLLLPESTHCMECATSL